MKRILLSIGLLGGLSVAQAVVVTTTWQFGGTPGLVAENGSSNVVSNSQGKITVLGEQVKNPSNLMNLPTDTNLFSATGQSCGIHCGSTLDGLFQVNDSAHDNGIGIAPYNDYDGSSNSFASQDGITDSVDGAGSSYSNILLLELQNFTQATSLQLLMQAGDPGDTFTVFTATGTSTPTNLNGMTDVGTFSVDEPTHGGNLATVPQVTINGLVTGPGGTQWIAIVADCDYLLANSVLGTPTATPEPRFYALLLVSLLAIPAVRRRFVPQQ